MRIFGITNYSQSTNSQKGACNNGFKCTTNPCFCGNIKNSFWQKLESYITSKFTNSKDEFVKALKPEGSAITKIAAKAKPIEVKNQQKALHLFLRDENFSKKVIVKNPDDGSYEIYERMFDAASHETRINADYYDIKGRLDHTTVFDNNGLMLSKYYVKINNPKDPILIRRKDYNVIGKITREEIKYKNGDVTYIDYDDLYSTQTYRTVKPDGSSNVIKNSKYASEFWYYDKNGNQLEYKIIEY